MILFFIIISENLVIHISILHVQIQTTTWIWTFCAIHFHCHEKSYEQMELMMTFIWNKVQSEIFPSTTSILQEFICTT